jgi:DNA-binding beta-propeller fold protein YncE
MRFTGTSFLLVLLTTVPSAPAADKVELVAGGKEGELRMPFGVVQDKDGNLIIAEFGGHRVRKVDAKGAVTTIAGNGKKGFAGDGGPALKAEFNTMHSLALAGNGDIYLADTLNHRVRKIAKNGVVSTFAGTGKEGFGGDGGPAVKADFNGIYCIAFGPKDERLYVVDLENRRVRAIDMKTGVVTTVAGNGKRGVPEDGADARKAPLVDPRAVAVDSKGKVYILERSGHALRVVDSNGKIRTVAGTGKAGYDGDGGPALKAKLNGPKHLCIDRDDNVLIADTENHVIRKYLPRESKIVHVAGTGEKGSEGVGRAPEKCKLNLPHGVYVSLSGVIYIADSANNRVLRMGGIFGYDPAGSKTRLRAWAHMTPRARRLARGLGR